MAIFTCKICGESVDSEHYIPETEKKLVENQICTTCLHWKEQHELDQTERGEHNFAIINGTHYVLCLHTDAQVFRGYGGRRFTIKFHDGHVATCDNLWCQGDIDIDHWRNLMPDNAVFIQ